MSGIDNAGEVDGSGQEMPVSAQAMPGEQAGDRIADWDLRPWALGGLLALCGLALDFTMPDLSEPTALHGSAAGFLFFGGLAAAFTLDRAKLIAAGLFALFIGLVMGGIAYSVAEMGDHYAGGGFVFAAGVFFTVLAVPLFQAGFHRTRFATDYRLTHFHVWADVVSGAGALAFTGLSWLMLLLLDQLFGLLGIDAIGDLMEHSWFAWMWSGAAFGAALGVLRENLKVIGTLQNVVMLVLALLAVPLAAAILVFVVLLLASGGAALWEATDSATPILLACAAGSFVMFNAIIRDGEDARSKNVVMLAAALVLAAVILPLVVFAAIGMGLRIDQRGLSPERIWALIAIAVAAAYGIAAWVAIARGRIAGWAAQMRQANLNLAAVVCALALVLALPLWDFGAVAARNQVARLASGQTALADFDFTALRWDFGDAGRAVLAQMAAGKIGGGGEAAQLAHTAQLQTQRPYDYFGDGQQRAFSGDLRMQAANPQLEQLVRDHLEANPWLCSDYCVAVDLGKREGGRSEVALVQHYDYNRVLVGPEPEVPGAETAVAEQVQQVELMPNSRVEIREERARYIYVDGKRMGMPVD